MNEKKSYWNNALMAFSRMSGWVVGPVVAALVGGKWLDTKYHTAPFWFLGCTAVAFLISIYGLLKETKKYLKNIQTEDTQHIHGTDNPDNRTD